MVAIVCRMGFTSGSAGCHAADSPSFGCTSFGEWLCLLSLLLVLLLPTAPSFHARVLHTLAQSSLLRRWVNVFFSHVCHTTSQPDFPSAAAVSIPACCRFAFCLPCQNWRRSCHRRPQLGVYEEPWRVPHMCVPITIDGSFMKAQLKCVWWAFSISLGNNL